MSKPQLLAALAALSLFTLAGAFFKIQHWPYGNVLLGIGMLAHLGFLLVAVPLLLSLPRSSDTQKIIWVAGLLLFSPLADLAFVIWYRRFYAGNMTHS